MRRRTATVSDVRLALVGQYRDLVEGTGEPFDRAYAYAPTVRWGQTWEALRDGRPARLLGDDLRAAGAPVGADHRSAMFELGADDSITLVRDPGGA